MDGYEFAASLQRSGAFNTIPVVMITSRSAEKHRERAFESGVSQYLTKPYDDKQLLDTIRELAKLT
jgi:chemosensory pili system protein ChpA (sensor histidine kinase/response regulator)